MRAHHLRLPSQTAMARGHNSSGQVAEWFKATVLKTVVGGSSPWVRIPPRPPAPLRAAEMAYFLGLLPDMSSKTVIYGDEQVANKADLMQRNGRWYFTKAYPKKLWQITGPSPFRKSLGTDSLEVAIRARPEAERIYFSKVDAARAKHEGSQPRQTTPVELMGIVARWFTEEDKERTDAVLEAQGFHFDIDGELEEIDHLSAEGRQELAEGDYHTVKPLALKLLEENSIQIDTKSKDFRSFMKTLKRAKLELLRLDRMRVLGDFGAHPSDPVIIQALRGTLNVPRPKSGKTVADVVKGYIADNAPNWAPSTFKGKDAPLKVLVDFFGADRDVATIERTEGRKLFNTVEALPVNYTKLKALKGLSLMAAVARGKELGLPTLKPKTVNDIYMNYIGGAFKWAVREQWLAADPMDGFAVRDTVSAVDKRSPFTAAQINKLFRSGPWAEPDKRTDGDPLRYWGPLVALYQGMRRGEIAQLLVTDNEVLENVPVIHVRPSADGKRVKSSSGRRVLPVHPQLIKMGYLLFVEDQRRAGHSQLFPDQRPNKNGAWGDPLTKWFTRLLEANGIDGVKLGMHSFRHNFEDALRAANLSQTPIGQELSGRAKTDKVSAGYGSGLYPISVLKPAVDSLGYPEVDLRHLYVT